MDATMTLNLAGYALAFAGGTVLGTLFGRKLVSDLTAMLHAVETRVTALEVKLGIAQAASAVSTAAAIHVHAAATEKLASAVAAHAAPATPGKPAAS